MRKSQASLAAFVAIGLMGIIPTTVPALANTRIQKTFDQWNVDCTETDKKVCGVYFRLVNSKNKRVVLGWAIVPNKDGNGNVAVVRTPTGMSLPAAVSVRFGDAEPVTVTYSTCGPVNCIGEVPFTEAWVKAFKSSASIKVTYTPVSGKKFEHEISLKGFPEAFNYYTEQAATVSGQ